MTIMQFLSTNTRRLTEAGISTARLDILVLMEDLLRRDRAKLLAHPEFELSDEQIDVLHEQISRRVRHVPLAYIRGKTEFYGREFLVNKFVLEPRPESETMINVLKKLPVKEATIIDVGTGSGALAVTAKLELPHAHVEAIDIDPNALKLASRNAMKHAAEIEIVEGDLLTPIVDKQPEVYALLCNLPYVPDSFQINLAAAHEPRLAIFGGPDGLDLYRKLFTQIDGFTPKPQYILTEAMPPQHETLTEIAAAHEYELQQRDDFIQVFSPRM
jgi:release factor glutamine methyltransferase